MRELDVLKDKRDVNLAATMTLMLGHKYSQTVGTYNTRTTMTLMLGHKYSQTVGTYNTRTTFTIFKTEKI